MRFKGLKYLVITLLSLCLFRNHFYSQKVGVVLSGGGAAGIAHVGFLKALEENNVPIDYIAGTSMGAIISALYASGYSPDEMLQIINSETFIQMATGKYLDKHIYYFKKDAPNASSFTFNLSLRGEVSELIPTNIVSPVALDYQMLKFFSQSEACANYNFDSLMIPFRCVAADVFHKKQVIFSNGHLTESARASATYPLYVPPIRVDGNLLFDGGLYNNFPSDVMYSDFFPDIILGCNVGVIVDPPMEDDLISQLKAITIIPTSYSAICDNGVVINPDVGNVGTFGFSRMGEAYIKGYETTKDSMEIILSHISRSITPEEKTEQRKQYRSKFPPLVFDKIEIMGVNKLQKKYIERSLYSRKKTLDFELMKERYIKIFSDDKIKSIYPKTKFNDSTKTFDLLLNVKPQKDFKVGIGGVFASRPVTTGMFSLKYNYWSFISTSFIGNYYFGRFYNSLMAKARVDVPFGLPFHIEPEFNMNKYDYFKSQNTFFDEDRPSYFVSKEMFGGINIGIPISNRGKLKFGWSKGKLEDEYYQERSFEKTDTSDKTYFLFDSPYLVYERSTQTEKLYPNSGANAYLSLRSIQGDETHVPGSTASQDRNFSKFHNWLQVQFRYENFYKKRGFLRLGVYLEGFYANQPLFNNYSASISRAGTFKPTTESNYLFLESFRANQYAAIGHKFLFSISNNLELRLSGYMFQPYQRIIRQDDNTAAYGVPWDKRYVVGSANLVAKTPVGPVSLSTNYYHNLPEISDETKTPLTFFFHFGYTLFNKRAFH